MKKVFLIMLVISGVFINIAYSAFNCGSGVVCGCLCNLSNPNNPLVNVVVTAGLIDATTGQFIQFGSGETDANGWYAFRVGSYSQVELKYTLNGVEYSLGFVSVGTPTGNCYGGCTTGSLPPIGTNPTSIIDDWAPRIFPSGEPVNIAWRVTETKNIDEAFTLKDILRNGGWFESMPCGDGTASYYGSNKDFGCGSCLATYGCRCSDYHQETFTHRSLFGSFDCEVWHIRGKRCSNTSLDGWNCLSSNKSYFKINPIS